MLYVIKHIPPHQVSKVVDEIVTDAIDWAMQAPLRARFSNLPTVDMKEILQQRMFKDKYYKAHKDHKKLYDALEKSFKHDYSDQILSDLEEARQKKRKRRDLPRTPSRSPPPQPPPLTPIAGASGSPGTLGASRSSQLHPPPPPSSTSTSGSTQQQGSEAPNDSILDKQVHLSNDEDSGNDHLPKSDSRKEWWKPLPEEERPPTPKPSWTIPSSTVSDVENNWATTLVLAYETLAENSLLAKTSDMMNFLNWYYRQVNKNTLTPTDLEGLSGQIQKEIKSVSMSTDHCLSMVFPGHVTIQTQFFFNKDLEYLRYGSKGSSPAPSISKIKAASYLEFCLELLVLEKMWIDNVCTYGIIAKYGISHWWFNRQKFYIDRHATSSRQKEVRSNTQILNVVTIKAYSRYGYDYLSESILRRADLQEHTIAEKDFKNLYPRDFEDLNLFLLQGYEFKHGYTIIESPRAIVFPVNNNKQKIMRFNKIYKFSDGTLTRIFEALSYRVKEFQIKHLNPGWDAKGYEFKDDYTIIESPRAVVFPVNNNERKIMRFNEIYKFSDGTLTRILEALDYRVKEFKNYKEGKVWYSFPRSRQSERDLPRDKPLVSVEVLRLKSALLVFSSQRLEQTATFSISSNSK
nr:hypothetical protein [Tanacetum cinerariifolium]